MERETHLHDQRLLGTYQGSEKGPLLLVTAGVHGNEPSGVEALRKVFSELERTRPPMKGSFIGILGNMRALQQEKRFIDEDLNRTWTEENLEKEPTTSEQMEMKEIIDLLKKYRQEKFTKRYFMDCHTTSSESLPYISVQEVGENDAFAHRFPVYIVRGFSDIVNGSIDKYFSKNGFTGFTFEGGQHTASTTQANQEAMIWLALKEANELDLEKISCYPECVEVFSENNPSGQKTFRILYRHGLENSDEFRMEPGFRNFENIKKGQLLAVQNGEKILSQWDATIFMPLYQSQGNDGFFVVQEV